MHSAGSWSSGWSSFSCAEEHSLLYKPSKKKKKKLIKNAEKLFFFLVFWFIKLIKHLDHDPAETENAPFIKLFGPDYPLPCNLSPCSGQAVDQLELIAFDSLFASA